MSKLSKSLSSYIKSGFKLYDLEDKLLDQNGEGDFDETLELMFENKKVGTFKYSKVGWKKEDLEQFTQMIAPLMQGNLGFEYNLKVLAWVDEVKNIRPELFDWVGIYLRASYHLGETGTDLVVGPYLGEATDHVRISLDKGFCGMALREDRVVNVEDVTQSEVHIACSLKTRSELVVPLYKDGESVAELDIDSNKLNAFSSELEKEITQFSKTFPLS